MSLNVFQIYQGFAWKRWRATSGLSMRVIVQSFIVTIVSPLLIRTIWLLIIIDHGHGDSNDEITKDMQRMTMIFGHLSPDFQAGLPGSTVPSTSWSPCSLLNDYGYNGFDDFNGFNITWLKPQIVSQRNPPKFLLTCARHLNHSFNLI